MRSQQKARLERALVRHVDRLDRRIEHLEERSRRYSWMRLGLVVGGGVTAWATFALAGNVAGALVLLGVLAAFGAVAWIHRRVDRSIRRHRLWRRIKADAVARMNLDWAALPPAAAGSGQPEHPFENDLNLTGPRSLHHLVDTTISAEGSERLRSWLLATTPDATAARTRQALVAELTPLSAFRDRLSLRTALVTGRREDRWDGARLLHWLERPGGGPAARRLLTGLGVLAGTNIVLFVLFALDVLPAFWIFTLLLYAWIYLLRNRAYRHLFADAEYLLDHLGVIRTVMVYLERHPTGRYPHLDRLTASFRVPERRPSRLFRRLSLLAVAASSQKNELAWLVLNTLAPWDLFFSYRLDRYKERIRHILPEWLDTWYELEALGALASFACLNPDYTLPDLVDGPRDMPTGPIFEAHQIGHPLLPDATKVRNDFRVDAVGDITLITGSNMSGKSTFLRTLGVSLSLAFAGGPVDARRLRTISFRLFTCINVSDSVNDGISYFYAEVRRLKALLEASRRPDVAPLFFLIDEIFRGTNNRERLIGSRSYVRALAGTHGAGLISTHDLELVHVADELPSIRNMHFREEVIDGQMVFEYRIHTGPSPTTNALKIMRREGLPVDVPELQATRSTDE